MESRVGYVDFVEQFNGIETTVRIFQTTSHLFVYVNQNSTEIRLYNEYLKELLVKYCRNMKNKKVEVICNLKKYESIDDIGRVIARIVNG